MRLILLLVSLLFLPTSVFPQDMKVRQEALQLLERATAASSPANPPNLERVDTFRVFNSDSSTEEGSFSRVVVQGTGRREESTLGSYHLVNVFTHGQVAIEGASEIMPPPLMDVRRLTPINLVRFDGEDIIHEIVGREQGRLAHSEFSYAIHVDRRSSRRIRLASAYLIRTNRTAALAMRQPARKGHLVATISVSWAFPLPTILFL